MTTSIRFMSYLTLTIGLSVTGQSMAQISDCSGQWQVFSQIPDNEGAFPDTHVSYFRYTFQLPAERKIMFKVSGRYPRGRYMGFNIYNSVQMDSKTGIADFEIEPDSGSENPYRTGDADTAGSYTLWMNPHEPKIAQTPMVNDLTAATKREEKRGESDVVDGNCLFFLSPSLRGSLARSLCSSRCCY